jgi:transcriptional regulator of acetoin/glycerol metabolism
MNFTKYKKKKVMEWERRFLIKNLTIYNWNISKTAEAVGLDRRNFKRLIKKHGLKKPIVDLDIYDEDDEVY